MSETTSEPEERSGSAVEEQPEVSTSQGAPAVEGEELRQQGAEAPPPAPPEPKPEQQPDWRDKRIATLTRRLREFQEQAQQRPPEQQPQQQHQDLSQQQIESRARELAGIQDFNRRCDETAFAGRAQFGESEFNGRIQNLQKLVDNSDPVSVQAYNSLLMAAIDTGEGARVLHALGADLNEAQRILSLQPTRMAVELTKKAVSPQPQLSNAPRPINPVPLRGGHERILPDDPDRADHLSTSEWMRRREQQVADSRNRR